jgi:dienelactone hydrolase
VVDAVAAGGNSAQTYALYLPSSYTPGHAWPILYCLDPAGRGRVPVNLFAPAAEKAGFIVAGSNNSRNGSAEKEREAIRWLLTDTHARLNIDKSRIYVAGMSGGARLALTWAQNGAIAGVIACAAGFGSEVPKQVPFRLYATAGVDDFNYDELFENSLELAHRGVAHRFVEFDGGHDWLPQPLTADAFDFFQGKAGPQAAQASKHQRKVAVQLESIMKQVQYAGDSEQHAIFSAMRRDAAKPEDSDDRRVARRALMGVFVGSVEQAQKAMTAKDYDNAARFLDAAVMARPDDADAWYRLAVARSAGRNKHGALDALEQAAANGFHDRARLEAEPLLERLRNEPRYRALVEKVK